VSPKAKDEAAAMALARTLLIGALDERREAATALLALSSEIRDIRAAQPALVVAILDPDDELRRRAVRATLERVESVGADVRLAFPALLRAVNDRDLEVRRMSWTIVGMADTRHDAARRAFAAAAATASQDPDEAVRRAATTALAKATNAGG
jgi:hypothetical protein